MKETQQNPAHTNIDTNTNTHTHAHSHTQTKAVINRLSRAIGHLEAVKMVENGQTVPKS